MHRRALTAGLSLHPDFAEIVKNKGAFSLSPVFSRGTAQAEFEVLCGVPVMREVSGIEFDVFFGSETPCLTCILSKAGYTDSPLKICLSVPFLRGGRRVCKNPTLKHTPLSPLKRGFFKSQWRRIGIIIMIATNACVPEFFNSVKAHL